jgi:pilus assembly protein CpaC
MAGLLALALILCAHGAVRGQSAPAPPVQASPPPKTSADADVLPAPRPVPAGPIAAPACPAPASSAAEPGATPRPDARVLKEYGQYIERTIDPENVLDLIIGRPRLLIFRDPPRRVQIGDAPRPGPRDGGRPAAAGGRVASFTLITDRELSVLGEQLGTTVLNIWFADPKDPKKDRVLSYLVRVFPDPDIRDRTDQLLEEARERQRLERQRQAKRLEGEINHAFPDSVVCLSVVGHNLVVSGQARDIAEATQIIRIVQSNAPRILGQPARATGREERTSTTASGDGTQPQAQPDGGAPAPPETEPEMTTTTSLTQFGLLGSQTQAIQTRQQDRQTRRGFQVINLLKVPGDQQVMLRVVVAEVNRAAIRSIGVNFAIFNNQGIPVFSQLTGQIATSLVSGTSGATGTGQNLGANNLPAALDGGQVLLAINALRNLNYARSLAEPNLVTLNGQTAYFQAGGSFPVPVVTGFTAAGLQGVQFVPFGVQLAFTPYVTDKDRIRLDVQANVSTRDLTTVNVSGSQVPSGLNTRNFQTVVELREGQTLAVAGLIQNNMAMQSDRVPWFGDLPILGRLGAFDRIQHGEQELIILVTPELVSPLEPKELPPLPGADLFEPGDLEFYLFGRLEGRRDYDFRSPVRTDINRLMRYRRCEDILIFGPHGHSDGGR